MNTDMHLREDVNGINTVYCTMLQPVKFLQNLHNRFFLPESLVHGRHVLKVCIEKGFQLRSQRYLQYQQTMVTIFFGIKIL